MENKKKNFLTQRNLSQSKHEPKNTEREHEAMKVDFSPERSSLMADSDLESKGEADRLNSQEIL